MKYDFSIDILLHGIYYVPGAINKKHVNSEGNYSLLNSEFLSTRLKKENNQVFQ